MLLTLVLLMTSFALAQDAPPDARVMADTSLRLRAAPTTGSDILALLDGETPLSIVGLSADEAWLRVQIAGGLTGWVYAEYVSVNIDLAAAFPDGARDVRLSPAVADHVRAIYADGQGRGRRANVFAKVGDSITVSTLTLNPVGEGKYDLGEYAYLQDVIDFYRAAETRDGRNSFNDESLAAKIGWSTFSVLDPDERNPDVCAEGESPLRCEYRVLKPAVALIMLGTNDVGGVQTEHYRANVSRIVQETVDQGIIPVLTTLPSRAGYEARVREFNAILTSIAAAQAIPLIDYGGAMLPLGEDGFDLDGVHPSVPPRGYDGAADFRPVNLRYGYVLRNLTALQMLDAIWRATAGATA